MSDFNELIPEMRDWNNGRGIDIESWVGCLGNFKLAIGYSAIFWPRFVEFENYVLREGFSVATLRAFELTGQNVEAVMNHLHIEDIHHAGCKDASPERLRYLGTVLREIYEAKLQWQFPHRQFEVHVDFGEEHPSDYQITFCQKHFIRP